MSRNATILECYHAAAGRMGGTLLFQNLCRPGKVGGCACSPDPRIYARPSSLSCVPARRVARNGGGAGDSSLAEPVRLGNIRASISATGVVASAARCGVRDRRASAGADCRNHQERRRPCEERRDARALRVSVAARADRRERGGSQVGGSSREAGAARLSDRVRMLVDKGAASRNELDDAERELDGGRGRARDRQSRPRHGRSAGRKHDYPRAVRRHGHRASAQSRRHRPRR